MSVVAVASVVPSAQRNPPPRLSFRHRPGAAVCGTAAALWLATCGVGALAQSALPAPLDRAALQAVLDSTAKTLLVPGAVVVLRTPEGNLTLHHGSTAYKGSVPTAADQHIRVGSNTKTWTATVILQQVQEGKLRLDDPVSKYRPEVPGGDKINIEQLLDMRSGLFNYSTTLELNRLLDEQPLKVWTQAELLALAFAHAPEAAPGAAFHYSNTNTILLGLIAQALDGGKPLAAIMHERLFKPLGLKHTLLPAIDVNTLPAPFARGYMYGNNVLTMGSPPALPIEMQNAARAGTLAPVDQTLDNPSWGWAAGAGISTADELATWVRALVRGGLLGPELQARRLASVRPVNPADPGGVAYGWGLARLGPMLGHTGELPGYNAFMGHDPVKDVTLVVWTNLGPAPGGQGPAVEIARALIGRLYAPR